MFFLIDGYNLMHAIGFAGKDVPLEKCRESLLQWMAQHESHLREVEILIVFDGQKGRGPTHTSWKGMAIRFSTDRTADEWIEAWIRQDARSERFTVVSNDSQVAEAARRGGCMVWRCQQLIDWFATVCVVSVGRGTTIAEKPTQDSPEEIQELLKAFDISDLCRKPR